MKSIRFKAILAFVLLLASAVSKAGVISLDEWFDSSGSNTAGLTQSTFNDSLFFAVAKDIDFSVGDTYEVTNGWHIATYDEFVSLWNAAGSPTTGYNHYGRNGWTAYTSASGASNHRFFAFQDMFDSTLSNKVAHAGSPPSHTSATLSSAQGWYTTHWGETLTTTQKSYFAGLVVIKDGTREWGDTTNVPEPPTLGVFVIVVLALVSRRMKRQ